MALMVKHFFLSFDNGVMELSYIFYILFYIHVLHLFFQFYALANRFD